MLERPAVTKISASYVSTKEVGKKCLLKNIFLLLTNQQLSEM